MLNEKIRITLKAYRDRVHDQSATKIAETAKRSGARVAGPIPLTTVRKKWTVVRSPHLDKKSREQFEIRMHKRLTDIIDPATQAVELVIEDEGLDQLANPYFQKIGESRKRARSIKGDISRLKKKTQAIIDKLP